MIRKYQILFFISLSILTQISCYTLIKVSYPIPTSNQKNENYIRYDERCYAPCNHYWCDQWRYYYCQPWWYEDYWFWHTRDTYHPVPRQPSIEPPKDKEQEERRRGLDDSDNQNNDNIKDDSSPQDTTKSPAERRRGL